LKDGGVGWEAIAALTIVVSLADRIAVICEGQIMDVIPRREATPEQLGLLMAGAREGEEQVQLSA
jgi:ABC-type sugar transport system ATPase subunit